MEKAQIAIFWKNRYLWGASCMCSGRLGVHMLKAMLKARLKATLEATLKAMLKAMLKITLKAMLEEFLVWPWFLPPRGALCSIIYIYICMLTKPMPNDFLFFLALLSCALDCLVVKQSSGIVDLQWNAMQNNTKTNENNAMESKAKQFKAMQSNARQYEAK